MNRNVAIAIAIGCSALLPIVPSSPAEVVAAPSTRVGANEAESLPPSGVRENGVEFDGSSFGPGGLRLAGGKIDGLHFHTLELAESGFRGTVLDGDESVTLSGTDFIGARLSFELDSVDENNVAITKRMLVDIDDVYPSYSESPILVHQMSVYKEDIHKWVDPCDNGGQGLIALQGAWDPVSKNALGGDEVTLACRDSALAKCTEWGYWPWAEVLDCTENEGEVSCEMVDLAELHQACTRMVRADYCGDGTPNTVDGTAIDVYDSLAIALPVTAWPVEAEWGPNGATCLGDEFRYALVGAKPSCLESIKQLPGCGKLGLDARLANRFLQ